MQLDAAIDVSVKEAQAMHQTDCHQKWLRHLNPYYVIEKFNEAAGSPIICIIFPKSIIHHILMVSEIRIPHLYTAGKSKFMKTHMVWCVCLIES